MSPQVVGKRFPVGLAILLFLFFCFISQLNLGSLVTYAAFLCSIIVMMFVALIGKRQDVFLFLFVVVSMRIAIPIAPDRDFQLVVPTVFMAVSLIRFIPLFGRIRQKYRHRFIYIVILFFGFCLIAIFNNIKVPGINSPSGMNSGLLNRFNLLNAVIVFFLSLVLFEVREIDRWISYYFRFYLSVLIISILIILFNIGMFPLFNSFSWSLVVESASSKKLIIAGLSGLIVMMYTLVFLRRTLMFYVILALAGWALLASGGRGTFAAAILMFLVYHFINYRVLGKSLIVLGVLFFLSISVLLSPVILYVPERFQRLVVIFPPEYYTGKLAALSQSAAASSTGFRLELWELATEKIKEHPLLGNSFGIPQGDYKLEGTYLEMFQRMPKDVLYNDFLVVGSLHNTFFAIAYLLGIPALILFVIVLVRLITTHYKKSLVTTGRQRLVAIFITMLLFNSFVTALVTDIVFDLPFYLLLAISIKALLFYYKNPDEEHVELPSGQLAPVS